MLVKKVGIILVSKLKLYKLIKILSVPLIILALVFPFSQWSLDNARQKYQFQQPSLRTKIFDLNYVKSEIDEAIMYHAVSKGIKATVFEGMLQNQCILLTFPVSLAQSAPVHILYQTLKNDRTLSKNIVLLTYQTIQDLNQLFMGFQAGIISTNFGTIRAAMNIQTQIRNKQKSKSNQLKAFFEIYGKGEIHVDVDYFQSIKELLERLHIDWSPCEQIHQVQLLKGIKRAVYLSAQFLGVSRSKFSLFLDHVLCQGYGSTFSNLSKSQQVMMQYGFQSSSLTFLSSESFQRIDAKSKDNSEKISKLAYSFVKEYSMQQDHLHSSTTLFYPLDNHYFISLVGTVNSGVILLLVGAVYVLGYLVEQFDTVKSTLTLINLIEIVGIWLEFRISQKLDYTLTYLLLKFSFRLFISMLHIFKSKPSNQISMQHFYCSALQFLLSVYLSVFNFSLFYLSAILALLSLIRKIKILTVIMLSLFLVPILNNLDTIKSQVLLMNSSNFIEIFTNLFCYFISSVKTLSLQFQIIMIPFLYGASTFLI